MTATVANKKDTRTIEFWVVEWDGMNRNKVLQPGVSFDEPWEDGYPQYKCSKYTAEVPDHYQVTNREDGVLWLFDMDPYHDKYPALAEVNHDMTTMRIDSSNNEGWSDGKNAVYVPIKPVKTK